MEKHCHDKNTGCQALADGKGRCGCTCKACSASADARSMNESCLEATCAGCGCGFDDSETMSGDMCPACAAPADTRLCDSCGQQTVNLSCPTCDASPFAESFDRFIDRILVEEGVGRPPTKPEDNPQRRRAAARQDRPGNRTYWRR